jgi:hypothetical protein
MRATDSVTIKAFMIILGEIQNKLRGLADYIHEEAPTILPPGSSFSIPVGRLQVDLATPSGTS